MATETHELDICNNCQAFTPEGALLVSAESRCGINFLKLYPMAIKEDHPQLVEKIVDCNGPEARKVPKKGVLGRLGFKDSVEVCPAVEGELEMIVASELEQHPELFGLE